MTNKDQTGRPAARNEPSPPRTTSARPRREQTSIGEPPPDPEREIVYGLSYTLSDEEARRSFDEEDERWSAANQLRDWVWLLVALLLWAAWTLAIYSLEPGLR